MSIGGSASTFVYGIVNDAQNVTGNKVYNKMPTLMTKTSPTSAISWFVAAERQQFSNLSNCHSPSVDSSYWGSDTLAADWAKVAGRLVWTLGQNPTKGGRGARSANRGSEDAVPLILFLWGWSSPKYIAKYSLEGDNKWRCVEMDMPAGVHRLKSEAMASPCIMLGNQFDARGPSDIVICNKGSHWEALECGNASLSPKEDPIWDFKDFEESMWRGIPIPGAVKESSELDGLNCISPAGVAGAVGVVVKYDEAKLNAAALYRHRIGLTNNANDPVNFSPALATKQCDSEPSLEQTKSAIFEKSVKSYPLALVGVKVGAALLPSKKGAAKQASDERTAAQSTPPEGGRAESSKAMNKSARVVNDVVKLVHDKEQQERQPQQQHDGNMDEDEAGNVGSPQSDRRGLFGNDSSDDARGKAYDCVQELSDDAPMDGAGSYEEKEGCEHGLKSESIESNYACNYVGASGGGELKVGQRLVVMFDVKMSGENVARWFAAQVIEHATKCPDSQSSTKVLWDQVLWRGKTNVEDLCLYNYTWALCPNIPSNEMITSGGRSCLPLMTK
jgi:hypothetical protein